uniref:Uncharacterized protein n=1 Tax=Hyaloperonospora arabidopsidis (strain Emoy2) TaxID=559515 RepID=M4BZ05_HYAAE
MSLFPGPYGEYAMVIIYVDDILSTTNNEELKGNMFEQLDQNYGLSESRTIQLIIGYTDVDRRKQLIRHVKIPTQQHIALVRISADSVNHAPLSPWALAPPFQSTKS